MQQNNAVLNYLEKSRHPTGNPDALFLRWRETLEKAMSDKFDAAGTPDAVSIQLYLKDFKSFGNGSSKNE